ncbi:uncharacterized protein LOC113370656 isoform X1 [Ctenocephalides felis]|uniref:uncharacterized protein LOC113370171 n=2 Tax=Ctenocephalides felis TaxID=7515 RepID=UPI000E6E5033|nr:uncharacterized protein LOC113370171 [Ctenocephalides felis]XP_026467136.1 uncharacterized protein LOC113370656 isoform X1 [Ctenocephalides felis]
MSNLNKTSKSNCFKKKHASLSKKKVLSMFVAMDQRAAQDAEEFFTSGRTGRRNAMADILGIHATTTTADMPERLQALTTKSTSETSEDNVSMETNTSSSQIAANSATTLGSNQQNVSDETMLKETASDSKDTSGNILTKN